MKKCIGLITILLILSLSIINNSVVYSQEKYAPKDDIIYNYLYNNIDKISKTINLGAKNIILTQYDEVIKNREKYINDVEFQINQINELEKDVKSNQNQYKDDEYITNGIYAISLMLNEYRYSLTLLRSFIENMAINDDAAYTYMNDFFLIKSEADRKLNAAKILLSK